MHSAIYIYPLTHDLNFTFHQSRSNEEKGEYLLISIHIFYKNNIKYLYNAHDYKIICNCIQKHDENTKTISKIEKVIVLIRPTIPCQLKFYILLRKYYDFSLPKMKNNLYFLFSFRLSSYNELHIS